MTPPPRLFDPALRRRRRNRSAGRFHEHDFLHQRAMEDVVDRLETVTRDFPLAAFSGAGGLVSMLTPACGVGETVRLDSAARRLGASGFRVVADDEASPLAEGRFDLFVSLLTLHAANDIVGALAQIRRALKPDGLFIGVVFGEETLGSLRTALLASETNLTRGAAGRVGPFGTVRDYGAALQRAGFALPVVDLDRVEVAYADPARLLADLKGMGETNVRFDRRALRRDVLAAALGALAADGGRVRFDLVTLTGWAPHAAQPKPLKPGSATHSLADAVRRSAD